AVIQQVLSGQGYGDGHVAGRRHLGAHRAHVEVGRLLWLRQDLALAAAQHLDDLVHGGPVVRTLLHAEKRHVDVPLHGVMDPVVIVPLMISRSRTPKLKTSDLTEQTPSEAYSGAMERAAAAYCVPTILVVFDSATLELKILAMPKSEIFGFISASRRMLLALRSLWTTQRRECMWSFAISWISFLNSSKPCREQGPSLFAAISSPSGSTP
ncbi:hypothetical protein U9M48_016150, partial [Paspalum notatum var. saurae]